MLFIYLLGEISKLNIKLCPLFFIRWIVI